jgi:aminopeptidase N
MRFPLLLSLLLVTTGHALSSAEELCVCRYCQGGARGYQLAGEPGEASGARHYAPDRLVDVLNIKIDVTPNYEERTIEGEATLTFAPISKPVDQLQLDAVDLRIQSVVGSQTVKEFVADGEHLTILFEEPLKIGREASVTIRYSAEPQKGLYFRTKELGYPDGDMHLWTQGEPHEARHWFPCFDYPNERSTSEVICRVPQELTVLSNGKIVSEEVDEKTGLKATHWRQDKSHANYLICLAAGRFAKLEDKCGDVKLGFYTQPSLAEHAGNAFADTGKIMEFYQEEIGVPYPWDKYDQVTILDFTSGGMENTTLTTLTHRTIFSDETENIHSSRNLDAHEMAHQWFGDYVTCEDWANLWLNEGFATYYTHLYNGHALGRDEMLYGLYRDAQGRVLTQQKDTRPIVYRDYSAAWDQFDFRAYPKGSWVLHMLRNQLGEKVYRQAIKNYLEKHALSSVSTPDLIAELEDASGQSLDRFFDQWVYHGGCPRLKIDYQWLPKEKLARVGIKQTQKTDDKVLMFHLPATVRFIVDGKPVDRAVKINQAAEEFYFPLAAKPEIVRFDPELALLAKIDFAKPQAMLEAQLKNEDDMIGRLMAVEALGKKKDKQSIAALRKALNNDAFYGVRVAAAGALGKRQTDEAYAALTGSMGQDDARVRLAVVEAVGRYYRPETLEKLKHVVQTEKNPAIAGAAVSALGAFHESPAYDAIRQAIQSRTFQNTLAVSAIEAAAKSADPQLEPELRRAIQTRRHELTDAGLASAMTALGKLAGETEDKTAARELLEKELNAPARRVQIAAVEALGELGDPKSVAALSNLGDAEDSRVASAAKRAIDKIEQDAPQVPAELGQLRKLVRELKEQQEKLQQQVSELSKKEAAKK